MQPPLKLLWPVIHDLRRYSAPYKTVMHYSGKSHIAKLESSWPLTHPTINSKLMASQRRARVTIQNRALHHYQVHLMPSEQT